MNNRVHVTLWEFQVKPDSISAFEKIYGPDGAWAQLFRKSPNYLGTELLRDLDHPGHYLALDRWTSREALQHFKQQHHSAYAALDLECEALTERETRLGDFEAR